VDVTELTDPEAIKSSLVHQAAAPVRWVETMQAMRRMGVTHVIECGPGKVLSGLAKRCDDGLVGMAMSDIAGMDAALAAITTG
jgi:[acyl-carrier-protein] S-malonyltransferase